MKVEVFPSELMGEIIAPGSKSIAQRLVACALLARGESVIKEFPEGRDCEAALNIAQALGAVVKVKGTEVCIKGGFPNAFLAGIRNPRQDVNACESGLSSRMFTPIAALWDETVEMNGTGTLLKRSFREFEHLLPSLGVSFSSNNGLLPITFKGPLVSGEIELNDLSSSQFLTGLLMALPRTNGESIIHVHQLKSKPYIEMTMQILKLFGVEIVHENFSKFIIKPSQFTPLKISVPGDWSGAAFILVAAALASEQGITVQNLSSEIVQGDSMILSALTMAGVEVQKLPNGIFVKRSLIKAFDFDANDCPDLFPPLVALAAFADGVSTIYGVKRLAYKESNRGKTLQQEFAKANIRIVLREDEMKIYPAHIAPAIINSHNDHRIAMAATVLGVAGARMTIRGAECVSKSFPDFFSVIQSLKGNINVFQSA